MYDNKEMEKKLHMGLPICYVYVSVVDLFFLIFSIHFVWFNATCEITHRYVAQLGLLQSVSLKCLLLWAC